MSKVKDEIIRLEEEADKIRGIRIEMLDELHDINLCSDDTNISEQTTGKQDEPEAKSMPE